MAGFLDAHVEVFDYLGISMYSGLAIAAILGFLFPILFMGSKKKSSWREASRASFAGASARYNRVTSMDGVSTINLSREGVGARKPTTVMARFQECVERAGTEAALKYQDADEAWQQITWVEYMDLVRSAAKSFMHLGLERFGCVSIIGFNSPEWVIADLAAIAAGGAAAGIYATNGPDACAYIAEHSSSSVVVVENDKHLAKFIEVKQQGRCPTVKALVVYKARKADMQTRTVELQAQAGVPVYAWDEFLALGEGNGVTDADLDARIADQQPGHVCTLIYTSGTTGNPKAVMARSSSSS